MNLRTKPADEAVVGASTAAAPAALDAAAPQPTGRATTASAPANKPEKTLSEPDEAPAIPRDEHHGRGGRYALVDGVRTPIDEDGKPLPAKK